MSIKPDYDMLVMRFLQDEPFTTDEKVECYFDRQTGQVIWHYSNFRDASVIIGISEGDWTKQNTKIQANPDRYIQVPAPSHSTWHYRFKEWLAEEGLLEAYTTSIGLTLKHLGYEKRGKTMRQSTKDSQASAFFNAQSLEALLNLSQTRAATFTRAGSEYRIAGGKHFTEDGNPNGYRFQVLRKRDATHYSTDWPVVEIAR